jgi:hypothetical protein
MLRTISLSDSQEDFAHRHHTGAFLKPDVLTSRLGRLRALDPDIVAL